MRPGTCTWKRRERRVYSASHGGSPLLVRMTERIPLMRVCLFEDRQVDNLEPLTLTRPAFELVCGQSSLAAKQWRAFAPCEVGVLVRPHLEEVQKQQRAETPVNDMTWLRSDLTVMVNSRWLPPPGIVEADQPCVA